MVMFAMLRRRRRRRLRETPTPDAWRAIAERNVPPARRLSGADRDELFGHVHVLLAEKHWEGCGDLVLGDEHRVTIAAWAALLLLHRETEYFPRLRSILVYPTAYVVDDVHAIDDDIVFEGEEELSGHTQEHLGALLVNWRDVKADVRDRHGASLVLHEFAHQLDFEAGDADGAPALPRREAEARWREVLGAELERLRRDVKRQRRTVLDPYGAEDAVEFFAVATEAFFGTPELLQAEHATLYAELSRFYRQDPAGWPGSGDR